MAEVDLLRKLEAKACENETIITFLKKEILELNSFINAARNAKLIATLKSEAESLEKDVLQSKEELIQLEKRSNSDEYVIPSAYIQTTTKTRATRNKSDVGADFGRLDLRVGKILSLENHPNASNLFIEQVDIGLHGKCLTVVSGLRKYETVTSLFLRPVIVVCNLKPATIRGTLSEGMLLCAIGNDTVEPLWPPNKFYTGDILTAGEYKYHPDPVLNKTDFESIIKELSINDDKELVFQKDIPVVIKDRGAVFARRVANCSVG